VAVDRGKSKDGEKRNPLWVGVTLWKEQAENLSKYISKGDPIAVS
jgi:single-stranded DNA-binding protein